MVAAYDKAHAPKEPSASQHVGTIGEKITMVMTPTRIIATMGAYGRTWIHILAGDDGNVYKWATGSARIEEGKRYNVTATIKAHCEYNGTAQTAITRAKCTPIE